MRRSLQSLLTTLRGGSLPRARLYDLSNLEEEEMAEVRAVWFDLPLETRQRTIAALAEIAEDDFEVNFGEVFRMALEDPDATVRQVAVDGLWEEDDIRMIPLLLARLREDPATEVRAAAAIGLGRFVLMGELGKIRPQPYRQAYQGLLTAHTSDEQTEVRRRALESLAYSGKREVAALIRAAYQHPDEKMRVSAIFAMGRSADERWASCVLEQLSATNPEMRYEAARACGELAIEEAIPRLVRLVNDTDPEVREATIWSLGQIGGDEARRVLRLCAQVEDEAMRQAAREALRELEFLHGDLGGLLLPFDFDEEEEEEEDFEDEDLL
jgi:HEAT repeat protein